jgi:hypothetical protein
MFDGVHPGGILAGVSPLTRRPHRGERALAGGPSRARTRPASAHDFLLCVLLIQTHGGFPLARGDSTSVQCSVVLRSKFNVGRVPVLNNPPASPSLCRNTNSSRIMAPVWHSRHLHPGCQTPATTVQPPTGRFRHLRTTAMLFFLVIEQCASPVAAARRGLHARTLRQPPKPGVAPCGVDAGAGRTPTGMPVVLPQTSNPFDKLEE